jgi:hypothetical protein
MKLTASQFGVLCTLQEFGPSKATEVVCAPSMDGSRKIKLEWHMGNIKTLSALELAGAITVDRGTTFAPRNAVGKPGLKRRHLTISISEVGRHALANS